jgi:hypothetical protein
MSSELAALVILTGVHIAGFGVFLVLLLSSDSGEDDGGDDGGGPPPSPPERPSTPPGGSLPLPDARPARTRLRDHGRLADEQPRTARRPGHRERPRIPERP